MTKPGVYKAFIKSCNTTFETSQCVDNNKAICDQLLINFRGFKAVFLRSSLQLVFDPDEISRDVFHCPSCLHLEYIILLLTQFVV